MNRDSIYVEIVNIRSEMQGISPKTELHQRLKKRLDELLEKTEGENVNTKIVKDSMRRQWDDPIISPTYKKTKKRKKGISIWRAGV